MAAAVRQSKAVRGTGAISLSLAFDSDVLAGSAILVFGACSNARTLTASDDNGNSYGSALVNQVSSVSAANGYGFGDLSVNSGATTCTITQNTGTLAISIGIVEVTGHDTGQTPGTNQTDKTTSDQTQTGAAQTPSANGVMLAWWVNVAAYVWSSNGAGWSEWATRDQSSGSGYWAGYPTTGGVVAASTTYTPTFTTDQNEVGVMVSIVLVESAVGAATATASDAITVTDAAAQTVGNRVTAFEYTGSDTLASSNW